MNASTELTKNDIPNTKPVREEAEIFADINALIGLEPVKKELADINALIKYNNKIGKSGKNAINLHTVFTGNPGTGKTTVAMYMAEMLYNIGFIRENKCVVCSAKDLIGEYTGQTAPKTAAKCEQAYNGILFIDEAYQLNPNVSSGHGKYEEECVAELLLQMENNKDKLVVILAGYRDEMKDFLNNANPGLKSRIHKTIEFPDYTIDELMDIFMKMVNDEGYILEPEVDDAICNIFRYEKSINKKFGNARFVRNLFEKIIMNHAYNTVDIPEGDPKLRILTFKDVRD
jgi:SpoVK/Ycf46/Vps4 family AAA+-type ATPase